MGPIEGLIIFLWLIPTIRITWKNFGRLLMKSSAGSMCMDVVNFGIFWAFTVLNGIILYYIVIRIHLLLSHFTLMGIAWVENFSTQSSPLLYDAINIIMFVVTMFIVINDYFFFCKFLTEKRKVWVNFILFHKLYYERERGDSLTHTSFI